MRKSKFSEAQIVAILQEGAAGLPIVELLRKHGISRPTFYLWRQKYGGAGVPELQKLKALDLGGHSNSATSGHLKTGHHG